MTKRPEGARPSSRMMGLRRDALTLSVSTLEIMRAGLNVPRVFVCDHDQVAANI